MVTSACMSKFQSLFNHIDRLLELLHILADCLRWSRIAVQSIKVCVHKIHHALMPAMILRWSRPDLRVPSRLPLSILDVPLGDGRLNQDRNHNQLLPQRCVYFLQARFALVPRWRHEHHKQLGLSRVVNKAFHEHGPI